MQSILEEDTQLFWLLDLGRRGQASDSGRSPIVAVISLFPALGDLGRLCLRS